MWAHVGTVLPYLIVMLGTLTINHVLNRQQAEKRVALETMRFRLALSIEMQALSTLYDDNLDLLNRDCEYVLSTRQSIIYRGNLNRLMSLDAPVLEQVVAVYAENERIEAFLAANAKSANAMSYRIAPATPETAALKRMFAAAGSNLTRARETLENCHNDRRSYEPVKGRASLAQACPAPLPREVTA